MALMLIIGSSPLQEAEAPVEVLENVHLGLPVEKLCIF